LAGQLRTVCLITTGANELMRGIHDRMPVIVPLSDYAAWLDPRNHAAEQFIRPTRRLSCALIRSARR